MYAHSNYAPSVRFPLALALVGLLAPITAGAPIAAGPQSASLTEAQGSPSHFLGMHVDAGRSKRGWSLIDAATGEVVVQEWANTAPFEGIAGTDDWVVMAQPAELDVLLGRVHRNGVLPRPFPIQRAFIDSGSVGAAEQRHTSPRVAALHVDGRRAITLEGGDLWRSEYDWAAGELVNKKRLTELGVFQQLQNPVWSGRHLVFWAGFDAAKPFARIDTESGAVEEIDWLNFTPLGDAPERAPQFATNPSRSVAMAPVGDWIEMVDLADGHTLRVPIDVDGDSSLADLRISPSYFGNTDSIHWTDDTHGVVFAGFSYLRVDLERAEITARSWAERLEDLIAVHENMVQFAYRIPDSNLAVLSGPTANGVQPYFVFDLVTDEVTLLPEDASKIMQVQRGAQHGWAGDRYFVYGKKDGGLSSVGLWIWDRESGEARRVASFNEFHQLVLLPEIDRLVVRRSAQGSAGRTELVHFVDLEAGSVVGEIEGWRTIQPLSNRRMALGFAGETVNWGESRERTLPERRANPEPLGGLAAVIESVADAPEDIRTATIGSYQALQAARIPDLYDIGRAVEAMMTALQESRDEMVEQARKRVENNTYRGRPSQIEAQKKQDQEILAGNFPAPVVNRLLLRANFSTALNEDAVRSLGREFGERYVEGGMGRNLSDAQKGRVVDEIEREILAYCKGTKDLQQPSRLTSTMNRFGLQAVQKVQRGG